jgi:exopolyphosphatase/guanosine-5'-triphosphate,3'-diphosphate pyrophosphatase
MRIATIDVGTNTALLLIAEWQDGHFLPRYDEEQFVRLGQGVDATRRVSQEALLRLRTTLLDYRAKAEAWQVAHIFVGATSASRDARNQAALRAFVQNETGLAYHILSGNEEALWTFRGAVSAFDDLDKTCAVVDIGGGSTEIVVGHPKGELQYRRSFAVGAVRMTERFFSTQPPPAQAVAEARRTIALQLTSDLVPLDNTVPLVGAAGTLVMLGQVQRQTTTEAAPDNVVLTHDEVQHWCQRLLQMTRDEVLALHPRMAGRADVFPTGVLILEVLMHQYGLRQVRVSPRGLRHGLALRFFEQP